MAGHPDAASSLIGAVCCQRGAPVNNEDNFYLNGLYKPLELADQPFLESCLTGDKAVFAVCDGMGGASYGEVASFLTVSRLREAAPALLGGSQRDDARFLKRASRTLERESARRRASLGAAAVLAVVRGDVADVCNVGDSRAYLLWNGRLTQLSQDHTAARCAQMLGLPIGSSPSLSHQLTQYLGMDEEEFALEPFCCRTAFPAGALLLLCSDGLTEALADREVQAVLSEGGGLLSRVERLTARALEAGGRDNVTALAVYRNP